MSGDFIKSLVCLGMAGLCYITFVTRHPANPMRGRKWITMDEVRTKRAAPKTMAALLEDDRIEPVDKLITAVLHFITGGLDFCDTGNCALLFLTAS